VTETQAESQLGDSGNLTPTGDKELTVAMDDRWSELTTFNLELQSLVDEAKWEMKCPRRGVNTGGKVQDIAALEKLLAGKQVCNQYWILILWNKQLRSVRN
jgi:hypothetical protein